MREIYEKKTFSFQSQKKHNHSQHCVSFISSELCDSYNLRTAPDSPVVSAFVPFRIDRFLGVYTNTGTTTDYYGATYPVYGHQTRTNQFVSQ